MLSQHHQNYIKPTFGLLLKMSLRAKSHTDLQTAGRSSLDDSLYKSFSMSSSNVHRGSRFGNGLVEEVKGLPRPSRRPVRVVRPVSAISSSGSFLQINHLQGELVRKRKVRRQMGCFKRALEQPWGCTSIHRGASVSLTNDLLGKYYIPIYCANIKC